MFRRPHLDFNGNLENMKKGGCLLKKSCWKYELSGGPTIERADLRGLRMGRVMPFPEGRRSVAAVTKYSGE